MLTVWNNEHRINLLESKASTLLDSSGGAGSGASAAAHASVSINLIDVAFGNSSDGALVDAGTASNASVSDFVSHNN